MHQFCRSVSSEIVAESFGFCRNHSNYTSRCLMINNDSFCFLVFVNGCSLFNVAVLINNSGRVVRLDTCNVSYFGAVRLYNTSLIYLVECQRV